MSKNYDFFQSQSEVFCTKCKEDLSEWFFVPIEREVEYDNAFIVYEYIICPVCGEINFVNTPYEVEWDDLSLTEQEYLGDYNPYNPKNWDEEHQILYAEKMSNMYEGAVGDN